MKLSYRMRPGAGFVVLLLTALLSAGFFGWGLSTPDLDVVWRLQLELRLGRRPPLGREELRLLQRALCAHPRLAEDLLEGDEQGLISAHRRGLVENGWAYLIRPVDRPEAALWVAVPPGAKKHHLEIKARTTRAETEGDASIQSPFHWVAPAEPACPTLIEVRTAKKSDDDKKRRSALIRLGDPP